MNCEVRNCSPDERISLKREINKCCKNDISWLVSLCSRCYKSSLTMASSTTQM